MVMIGWKDGGNLTQFCKFPEKKPKESETRLKKRISCCNGLLIMVPKI